MQAVDDYAVVRPSGGVAQEADDAGITVVDGGHGASERQRVMIERLMKRTCDKIWQQEVFEKDLGGMAVQKERMLLLRLWTLGKLTLG